MKTAFLPLSLVLGLMASVSLQAQVPQLINYQGRVVTGGTNFTGTGQFRFALVNGTGSATYWSNDGSSSGGSEPATAVSLAVSGGLYSVLLGDATLPNMTLVPATVFTNSDVRLRVWFDDGISGSQLLAPDQRIAAVGYAMMAANVVDGVITAAKLANGAVTSTKLADGAVTTAKLATNSVTSVQLGDTVELGATNVYGLLNVYRTSAGTPAISLSGNGSLISTYGSDGEEQVRIAGSSWGEIQLNNSLPGNDRGVWLSANSSSGGFLRLYNSNGVSRASLSGANTGGSLTLYQADGGTGAFLDGDYLGAGLLQLANTNGYTRIGLYGQSTASGGEISVNDANGTETVELLGQTTSTTGGKLTLKKDDGTAGISLEAEETDGRGGRLALYNSTGVFRAEIDADDGDDGAAVTLYAADGSRGLVLDGESGGAGLISVYNTNSVTRLTLDGLGNGGGGEIVAYANDGSIGARVYGDSGGGGFIGVYNTNGSTRLSLDGYGSNGGGQVTVYSSAGSARTVLYGQDSNGDGRIVTDVVEIRGGSDLSEKFDIRESESLQPGMVVSIDSENPGTLRLSAAPYDRAVAGVISGAGGVKTGMLMGQSETKADGKYAVALTGRVYCQADASHGAIRPGDLLTTSDTPGHAMKVTDHARAQGAIIGKAMTSLESGKGLVLVLVSLQ